jgi:hypothetical protein
MQNIYAPPPNAARRVVRALADLHERIGRDLGRDDAKAPFLFLHLPGGEKFNIRHVRDEGPLVWFSGQWTSRSTIDYVLVAPEAVIVSFETVEELGVPDEIVFELPGEQT